nr:hypothetical protein [Lachnospiraceae bacterium]
PAGQAGGDNAAQAGEGSAAETAAPVAQETLPAEAPKEAAAEETPAAEAPGQAAAEEAPAAEAPNEAAGETPAAEDQSGADAGDQARTGQRDAPVREDPGTKGGPTKEVPSAHGEKPAEGQEDSPPGIPSAWPQKADIPEKKESEAAAGRVTELTAEGRAYDVKLTFRDGASVPEGTKLHIRKIERNAEGDAAFRACFDELDKAYAGLEGREILTELLFEISFSYKGEALRPEAGLADLVFSFKMDEEEKKDGQLGPQFDTDELVRAFLFSRAADGLPSAESFRLRLLVPEGDKAGAAVSEHKENENKAAASAEKEDKSDRITFIEEDNSKVKISAEEDNTDMAFSAENENNPDAELPAEKENDPEASVSEAEGDIPEVVILADGDTCSVAMKGLDLAAAGNLVGFFAAGNSPEAAAKGDGAAAPGVEESGKTEESAALTGAPADEGSHTQGSANDRIRTDEKTPDDSDLTPGNPDAGEEREGQKDLDDDNGNGAEEAETPGNPDAGIGSAGETPEAQRSPFDEGEDIGEDAEAKRSPFDEGGDAGEEQEAQSSPFDEGRDAGEDPEEPKDPKEREKEDSGEDLEVLTEGGSEESEEGEKKNEKENEAAENEDKKAESGKEDDTEEEAPEMLFEERAGSITIRADAPRGALPPDAEMFVKRIEAAEVEDAVREALGEAAFASLSAFSISFRDAAGNEILPEKAVGLHFLPVEDSKEEAFRIIRIDEEGRGHVLEEEEGTALLEEGSASAYVLAYPRILTASYIAISGENYEFSVTCGPEAGIPEGAVLRISEAGDPDLIRGFRALAGGSLREGRKPGDYFRLFDIKIVKDGQEIQPADGSAVTVSVTLKDAGERKLAAVHFAEEAEAEGGLLAELLETESPDDAGRGNFFFETGSFSYFGFFTVDFAYQEKEYRLRGMESLLLSELLEKLGIDADTAGCRAHFSDPALLKLSALDADGNVIVPDTAGWDAVADWHLESLRMIGTEETLTLTLADGALLEIRVTDEIPLVAPTGLSLPSEPYALLLILGALFILAQAVSAGSLWKGGEEE